MSELYTIEDIAAFTGLTGRTLRDRLPGRVNQERVRFAYSYGVNRRDRGSARVILAGPSAAVRRIMTDV